MTIHKEGTATIIIAILALALFNLFSYAFFCECKEVIILSSIISFGILAIILFFFRKPNRKIIPDETKIVSPADGKIVVIEETTESEYLKQKCLQVSIFMSVWNIHINRYPVSGNVIYTRHSPGEFLLAINPKSSEKNERHTTVIETKNKIKIAVRQIAGIMARRIVCYAQTEQSGMQGDELGFIKFGSRVDLFLPLGTKLNVKIGDMVTGNKTIISNIQ